MHVQFIKAELHIDDLLVGDIVHLSADVRILEAGDRFVSQASLTDCPMQNCPDHAMQGCRYQFTAAVFLMDFAPEMLLFLFKTRKNSSLCP